MIAGLHGREGPEIVDDVDNTDETAMAKREDTSRWPPSSFHPGRRGGYWRMMTMVADGGPGQNGIVNLPHAGDAAEGDVVGLVAPVEAQGIDGRRHGDDEVGPD